MKYHRERDIGINELNNVGIKNMDIERLGMDRRSYINTQMYVYMWTPHYCI